MGVTTEPPWLHKSKGVAAANGTNTHAIAFTTDGDAPFTPATGSLLVVVIYGAVTHTASGWTEQLSPVSSGELSVFTKTSAPDTGITVVHNASNFMSPWEVFELPAGSAWTGGASSNQGDDSWSTLGGLPGTEQLIIAARGRVNATSAATSADTVWGAPWVEDADLFTVFASGNDNGYLTVAHQINFTGTGITPAQATTYGGTWTVGDRQNVVFAINAVAPSSTTPFTKDVVESYRVFGSFTKDAVERYRITNSMQSDKVERYRVLGTFTKDVAETYRVLGGFTKSLTESYRVLNGWTKDQVEAYRVLGSWTTDRVERYRVLNAFTKDLTETYTIVSTNGFVKDVVDNWRVYNAFTADRVERFSVLAAWSLDSVERYRVANAWLLDRVDNWRVYRTLTKDLIERYRILSDIPPSPLPADVVAYLEDTVVATVHTDGVTAYM